MSRGCDCDGHLHRMVRAFRYIQGRPAILAIVQFG